MPLTSKLEPQRTEILQKLLEQSPFLGWTELNLQNVSRELGYTARITVRAFPNGLRDVINAHADLIDKRMLEATKSITLSELSIRKKISTLILLRMDAMSSHRDAISRLIPLLSTPQYLPTGTRILYRTVDIMWTTAGDTSTDFNYYSKRSLLAGVYCSTLLFWLTDSSKNYMETREFLGRRIANVMSLQKLKPKIRSYLPTLGASFSSFCSTLSSLRRTG